MTAREWLPGDVAMVTSRVTPPTRRIYGEYPDGQNGCWYVGHGGFVRAENVVTARPLVVIDPQANPHTVGTAAWIDWIEDQYRTQTAPPKPDEPTGLGAVVEAAGGARWVRMGPVWINPNRSPISGRHVHTRHYSQIAAVKVLSEGWSA
jgi:hypothetical protein